MHTDKNRFLRYPCLSVFICGFFCLLAASLLRARAPGTIASRYAASDFPLTADPHASQWINTPAVFAENGPRGEPVPGHRTEIRSRWTAASIYFLFICPYQELHLKPNPSQTSETNELWNWDVAEVFVGSDFQHITRYKEFEVSPQGEWVDLDIDRVNPLPEGGWLWNSGFAVKARIDARKKVWYGEMRIPCAPSTAAHPLPAFKCASISTAARGASPAANSSPGSPPEKAAFTCRELSAC